jgi:prolyl-tRNA synthetase
VLRDIQVKLYERAKKYRDAGMKTANSYEEFKQMIELGGFVWAHWDGSGETERKIQEETQATIRCIPFDAAKEAGACMVTGKPSAQRVAFARAY